MVGVSFVLDSVFGVGGDFERNVQAFDRIEAVRLVTHDRDTRSKDWDHIASRFAGGDGSPGGLGTVPRMRPVVVWATTGAVVAISRQAKAKSGTPFVPEPICERS